MNGIAFIRREPFLAVSLVSATLFLTYGSSWLTDLSNLCWFGLIFTWLFLAILISTFAVVCRDATREIPAAEP